MKWHKHIFGKKDDLGGKNRFVGETRGEYENITDGRLQVQGRTVQGREYRTVYGANGTPIKTQSRYAAYRTDNKVTSYRGEKVDSGRMQSAISRGEAKLRRHSEWEDVPVTDIKNKGTQTYRFGRAGERLASISRKMR
jgi:hypothetical protein